MAPPSKMGSDRPGAKLQVPLPPSNRADKLRLAVPMAAVRLMRGKKLARATPMFAFMARSWCSAAAMSGRRSSTADGRLAGKAISAVPWPCSSASPATGSRAAGTGPPTSSASACWSLATCVLKAATSRRAASTVVWFCASTRPDVAPSWCMRWVSAKAFSRAASVSCASFRRCWSAARFSQACTVSPSTARRTFCCTSVCARYCCRLASLRLRTRPQKSSSNAVMPSCTLN